MARVSVLTGCRALDIPQGLVKLRHAPTLTPGYGRPNPTCVLLKRGPPHPGRETRLGSSRPHVPSKQPGQTPSEFLPQPTVRDSTSTACPGAGLSRGLTEGKLDLLHLIPRMRRNTLPYRPLTAHRFSTFSLAALAMAYRQVPALHTPFHLQHRLAPRGCNTHAAAELSAPIARWEGWAPRVRRLRNLT